MNIQLFSTNMPVKTFKTFEELLKHEEKFQSGWWIFKRTTTYKMTSFSEELKEAISTNPEEVKISFSKSLVTINAFGNKQNLYSKAISL